MQMYAMRANTCTWTSHTQDLFTYLESQWIVCLMKIFVLRHFTLYGLDLNWILVFIGFISDNNILTNMLCMECHF